MDLPVDTRPEPIGPLLKQTAAALGDLVERHVEMARVELARDTDGLGTDTGLLAAAALTGSVGYLLVSAAMAAALAPVVGAAMGLVLVGSLNLLLAGVAASTGLRRLRARHLLDDTRAQLGVSARQLVASLKAPETESSQ
jgi:uncharacterized membrane protein YqjE